MCTFPARALGPHECIILANKHSPDSKELANYYAQLRKIPSINVIHLDIPEHAREATALFTPGEFRQYIYDPVIKIIGERKIASHILVWLYSLDFPTTISTAPAMSLTGMTFVRGQPPSGSEIQSGKWISPLYRGPDQPDGPAGPTMSMEQFTLRLTTNMPIPSMMLGWSGSRGMTLDEIKQQLRVSASADGTHPSSAGVYFELNEDIRSKSRVWQVEPATTELLAANISLTATAKPPNHLQLMGVMAGKANPVMSQYGLLRPGAYADHLTSYGALFHGQDQTKITSWLRLGAAGTAGTITEPGSLEVPVVLWTKFPALRLFHHYAQGATLLESLFQSTRSPLQILFIGDALCAPWAKSPVVTVVHMADDPEIPVRGKAEFAVSTWDQAGARAPIIMYLLDGRPIILPAGGGSQVIIDTTSLVDGYHELRAIAYGHDTFRRQGFGSKGFTTRNRDQSVAVTIVNSNRVMDVRKPITIEVSAEGDPEEIAIVAQERIIASAAYTNPMTMLIDPSDLGAGRVSLQAVAAYSRRQPARSNPVTLELGMINQPPVVKKVSLSSEQTEDRLLISASNSDPDGDTTWTRWYYYLIGLSGESSAQHEINLNIEEVTSAYTVISANEGVAALSYMLETPNRIEELRVTIQTGEGLPIDERHQAGLVFNYIDKDNYLFWGMDGQLSAWTLKKITDGLSQTILSRGAPIRPGKNYVLSVASSGNGQLDLCVNDLPLARAPAQFGPGRVGVRTGLAATRVEDLMVTPATAAHSFLQITSNGLLLPASQKNIARAIRAGATDGQLTSMRAVENLD